MHGALGIRFDVWGAAGVAIAAGVTSAPRAPAARHFRLARRVRPSSRRRDHDHTGAVHPAFAMAELKRKGGAKPSGGGHGGGKAPGKAAAKGAGAAKPSSAGIKRHASGGAGGGAPKRPRDSAPNAHGGDAKAPHQAHVKATA
eukprot:365149-Chlamydomonas_euryale.AAC.10